jgi:gas vesicle protein
VKVGYFLAGVGMGALVALLFAPESGEKTRKLIARKAEEGKDYVASKGREFIEQAEELAQKGREVVAKQKERLTETLAAGKEAVKSTF